MAFQIENYNQRTLYDFKTRMSGGGARPNLFECVIKFPSELGFDGDIELDRDTRFLIKAAELPASNVNAISVPFRGRTLKLAGDRTFEPWTITVINDTNFRIRNAFELWLNYINRHDDNSGVTDPKAYQQNIIVHQLSRGPGGGDFTATSGGDEINILKSYQLTGAFPTNVGAITLGYEQGDTIEEYPVTFEYQWWDTFEGGSDTSMLNTSEDGIQDLTPPLT